MKKFLIPLFCLFSFTMSAQVEVDGVNINELEEVNIVRIFTSSQMFSRKVMIIIDYGQDIKFGQGRGSIIKDRRGELVKFNSVIAAINWMEQNGWEYLDTTVTTNINGNSSSNFQYFYFRRKESNTSKP